MGYLLLQGHACWPKECRSHISKSYDCPVHDMMHTEMDVYVDDMIVKSMTEEDHFAELQNIFERLRKYNLDLNPTKCVIGVTSGKLLDFIVNQQRIEID